MKAGDAVQLLREPDAQARSQGNDLRLALLPIDLECVVHGRTQLRQGPIVACGSGPRSAARWNSGSISSAPSTATARSSGSVRRG